MKVAVHLVIDVGDEAYADVVTYYIGAYDVDSEHTIEQPSPGDVAEAVEDVVRDILTSEFSDLGQYCNTTWEIEASLSEAEGQEQ